MKIGNLLKSAQRLVDKRGGTENLKEDAMELKDIVSGKGSLTEKAKEAGEALQTPGAPEKPKTNTHGANSEQARSPESESNREAKEM